MIMGVMVGSDKAGSPTAIHSSSRTKNKKIGLFKYESWWYPFI
jgi:hypothetical protein